MESTVLIKKEVPNVNFSLQRNDCTPKAKPINITDGRSSNSIINSSDSVFNSLDTSDLNESPSLFNSAIKTIYN